MNVTSLNSGSYKGRWITNITIDSNCQKYDELNALLLTHKVSSMTQKHASLLRMQ